MPKHRKNTRRIQKGGFSLNPFNWIGSSDPNAPKRSWSDWAFGTTSGAVQGASNMLSSATNTVSGAASSFGNSIGETLNSNVNLMETTPVAPAPPVVPQEVVPQEVAPQATQEFAPVQEPAIGGRRKKHNRTMKKVKRRQMKGGKGGLGLTYYASPVSGLKVAAPTYLEVYANGTNQYTIKGGSRRRARKGRKTRRQ